MRSALAAALTLLLVWLAIPVPAVLADDSAAPQPKVVVVVGPVGSHNKHYKEDARQVVAEAKKYTSNVVKLFTPDATWSRVKAAMQGASIFVYLGHGNGWPSIYGPEQTVTKNGLGLDPASGADGVKTVYYGEDYLREHIRFAPNAVVLLYHLCYASGNTEPGLAVGPFADSRERVDNYGAGFIGAGARTVIAEGHPAHPVVHTVRQLFTTKRTMESIFRSSPVYHGNVLGPYPAERTPGLQYLMDPDSSAPSGFYRSIIGDLSLGAAKVVNPGLAPTDTHPADFVVPGGAEVVAAEGAGLWGKAVNAADPENTSPPTTLAAGTRLRVTSEEAPMPDGTRIFGVKVLGGSGTGYARASALAPRDSAGVEAWSLDASSRWLSPNDDGVGDSLVVATRFSEGASAALTIKNAAGTTVKTLSATGDIVRFNWNMKADGALVPDGEYTWTLKASDSWGNPSITRSGDFTVDGTPPVTQAGPDGVAGAAGWLVSPANVTLTARDSMSGVKSTSWRLDGGTAASYSGPATVSTNGVVSFEYRSVDKAGIKEPWRKLTLRIDTKAPAVTFDLAGKAGDVPGMFRGPVTVTPTVRDPASGIDTKRVIVDDADPTALGSDPIEVSGEGDHSVTVVATDVAGNRSKVTTTFTIDTKKPSLELTAPSEAPLLVTPNGDGIGDTVAIPYRVSEAGTVTATVTGPDAAIVRTVKLPVSKGETSFAWDGRSNAGAAVADGAYTVTLTPRDGAGNNGEASTAAVDVYAALSGSARTPVLFFPHDGDKLRKKTKLGWTLLSPATVSIRVLDTDGDVVRTGTTGRADAAGPGTWSWDGTDDAGALVPRGVYRVEISATNGSQSATQSGWVRADAFRVETSVTTARRGGKVVVTATSSEPLSGAPVLVVKQPGKAAVKLKMTKASKTTWTATAAPKKDGGTGTLVITVKGVDTGGGTNATKVRLPLE